MYPTCPDSPAFPSHPSKRPASSSLAPPKSSSPPPQTKNRRPIKKRKVFVPKPKKRVRFHEEIAVRRARVFKTPPSPYVTWLREKDLTKIREGVFGTLDALKRKRDAGLEWQEDVTNEGKHCARGLEDYSLDRQGCLKASTIHRRQNAIRAVMHEQEIQLRRHQLRRLSGMSSSCHGTSSTSSNSSQPTKAPRRHSSIGIASHGSISAPSTQLPRRQPKRSVLDPFQMSRVYRKQTEANLHEAISKARVDSEIALAIYSEKWPKPQPPKHLQARHRRPSLLAIPPRKVVPAPPKRKPETTWGFAPSVPPPPPRVTTPSPPPPKAKGPSAFPAKNHRIPRPSPPPPPPNSPQPRPTALSSHHRRVSTSSPPPVAPQSPPQLQRVTTVNPNRLLRLVST